MGDHPVKVPEELVEQWEEEWNAKPRSSCFINSYIADRAAQWGADQELEACIKWFDVHIPGYELVADRLRTARRPKPPSLAEQGIEALSAVVDVLRLGFPGASINGVHVQTLTAALDRLAELEAQQ